MNKVILMFCGLTVIFSLTFNLLAKPEGDNPAAFVELTILSNEKRMSGFAYLAAGKGPHPTILLLHGYPGNEKNLDVAQALRHEGWNVVFFHYRGAWGSEGEFSYLGAEEDVQVVINYLRDKLNASKLRVDSDRISIVGHSMGGHMALAATFDNPAVKCVVAYDNVNLGAYDNDARNKVLWSQYGDSLFMLNGWSGAKAKKETSEQSTKLDLVNRAHKIGARPILFIPANSSVIDMNIHIEPIVTKIRALKNSNLSYQLIEDDHAYSNSRLQLIEETASFLNSSCR